MTNLQITFVRIEDQNVILRKENGKKLSETRTWTIGSHQARGKLVDLSNDRVVILKEDGGRTVRKLTA